MTENVDLEVNDLVGGVETLAEDNAAPVRLHARLQVHLVLAVLRAMDKVARRQICLRK